MQFRKDMAFERTPIEKIANEERGTKFITTGTMAVTVKLKRCSRGLGGMTPRIVL